MGNDHLLKCLQVSQNYGERARRHGLKGCPSFWPPGGRDERAFPSKRLLRGLLKQAGCNGPPNWEKKWEKSETH